MTRFLFIFLCIFATTLRAEERVVVGIHGLQSSSRTLLPITRGLEYSGFDVYLWDYASADGTITEHAHCLVSYLQKLTDQHPGKPIDFFTHSVGSLVLRAALNLRGCPKEAKMGRAVLIAGPNQGSRLAREMRGVPPVHWALGSKIGCELMSYEPCDMQRFGQFPKTMEVLVIAGTRGKNLLFTEENDGYVAVSETYLETPFYFQSYRLNHGALLVSPKVIAITRSFLYHGGESESSESGGVTKSASRGN